MIHHSEYNVDLHVRDRKRQFVDVPRWLDSLSTFLLRVSIRLCSDPIALSRHSYHEPKLSELLVRSCMRSLLVSSKAGVFAIGIVPTLSSLSLLPHIRQGW